MFSRHVLIPAAIAALIGTLSCAGQTNAPSPPSTTPAPPTTPAGPPKPLDGVMIGITAGGLRLDAATAAMFTIDALRVYKGARITFINQDTIPHDIQSDPIFVHTECRRSPAPASWFPVRPSPPIHWIGS